MSTLQKEYLVSKIIIFTTVIILSVSQVVYGADCFQLASERYSVPDDILRAISKVESGGNPYAVNIGGKSYYPSDLSEVVSIFAGIEGKSFDIGLMQVNNWWFKKYGYPFEWGLNACWSIYFGAHILRLELDRADGDIWKAVGRYHSPTEWRQRKYIEKVVRELG